MDKSQLENSLKDMQEQLEHAKKVRPRKEIPEFPLTCIRKCMKLVFIDVQLNTDKDNGAGLQ